MLFRRVFAIVFELIDSLFEFVDSIVFLGNLLLKVVNTVGERLDVLGEIVDRDIVVESTDAPEVVVLLIGTHLR
ncbi:hypothetical protein [Haladaptatus halobius]|uniref:hypothetical protein n=1 Tax=Haladaptatus halobius TaxID=2884875 RepID=UPI001D0B6C83|nr:hypothetical protein [Haladaptatus halobius]